MHQKAYKSYESPLVPTHIYANYIDGSLSSKNETDLVNERKTFKYERFAGGESINKSVRASRNLVEYEARAFMFLVAIFFE